MYITISKRWQGGAVPVVADRDAVGADADHGARHDPATATDAARVVIPDKPRERQAGPADRIRFNNIHLLRSSRRTLNLNYGN